MSFVLPFGIVIDLSFIDWFISLSISQAAGVLFAVGLWVILAERFFKMGLEWWVQFRQNYYIAKWQWQLLAVDVPPLLIQTPKAVEQIFAHLSGAQTHINVRDKFWTGKKQKFFSFEIISIEGYIQFLVRTEAEFRDLVEAAIYAQYPEAEITEVEDYVGNIPDKYPDSAYDVMGIEFKLEKEDAYPLRTYPDFQYNLSKDAVFSDPMAAMLENFARINQGENFWLQIIIEPVDSYWKKYGIELAKSLLAGEEGGGHSHSGSILGDFINSIISIPGHIAKDVATHGFLWEAGESEAKEEDHEGLTPGMKGTVELIEEKINKIGFKSKLRVLYASRKDVYNPDKCIGGAVGAISQFHSQNRNSLVPYMGTHSHYDSKRHTKSNRLKNTFVKVFKKRHVKWKKCNTYILNIEELATIWHFPLPFVKTPLLQKSGYKRGEPPASLPTEMMEIPLKKKLEKQVALAPAPIEPKPSEKLPYA